MPGFGACDFDPKGVQAGLLIRDLGVEVLDCWALAKMDSRNRGGS